MGHLAGKLALFALIGIGIVLVASVGVAVLGTVVALVAALAPFILLGALLWALLPHTSAATPLAKTTPYERKQPQPTLDARVLPGRLVQWFAGLSVDCLLTLWHLGGATLNWGRRKGQEWTPVVAQQSERMGRTFWSHLRGFLLILREVGSGTLVGGLLGAVAGWSSPNPELYVLSGALIGMFLGSMIAVTRSESQTRLDQSNSSHRTAA